MSDVKVKEFYQFAYKRQLIYHKRHILKLDPPWSDEDIFQKQRFLNVYRELDKTTKYHLDLMKGNSNRKSVLMNTLFFKIFNRVGIYEDLGLSISSVANFSQVKKSETLRKGKSLGKSIFNDAYIIASNMNGTSSKFEGVLKALLNFIPKVNDFITKMDTLETPKEAFEHLQSIQYVGDFLAYEIFTHLSYFKWFKQKWTEDSFVNIGPGAEPSIHYIFGKSGDVYENFEKLYEAQDVIKTIHKSLNEKLPWSSIKPKKVFFSEKLSRLTIENICCEFRKYKAHTGGNPDAKKRKFDPEKPHPYLSTKKVESTVGKCLRTLEKRKSRTSKLNNNTLEFYLKEFEEKTRHLVHNDSISYEDVFKLLPIMSEAPFNIRSITDVVEPMILGHLDGDTRELGLKVTNGHVSYETLLHELGHGAQSYDSKMISALKLDKTNTVEYVMGYLGTPAELQVREVLSNMNYKRATKDLIIVAEAKALIKKFINSNKKFSSYEFLSHFGIAQGHSGMREEDRERIYELYNSRRSINSFVNKL